MPSELKEEHELPPVEPSQLGNFLIVALAVIGAVVMVLTGVNQWRKLYEKKEPPVGKEYVTASQLTASEARLSGEMARMERDHKEQLTELRKYVADSFHANGNNLQILTAKLEALPTKFQEVLDRVIDPLTQDTKRNMIAIASIKARLAIKNVNPESDEEDSDVE